MEAGENLQTGQLSKADLDWAVTFPAQKAEQIRQYCQKNPEANEPLILKGHILDLVYGDFNGLFGGPLIIAARKPEPTRQVLSARLNWMIGLPQTPKDLRENIEKYLKVIDSSEWKTPEDITNGEKAWKEGVQNEVVERIAPEKKREKLAPPIDPYREAWEEYWKYEHGQRRQGGVPWVKPTK